MASWPTRRARAPPGSAITPQIGHELTVSLPDEPVHLHADPVRLAQLFSNLLNNASKYTPQGRRISLSAARAGTDVVVQVTDTGIGIAPEQLPRVFEMFSQAKPALERADGGLDIGLALVRGLAQMHGGTVTAHSEGIGHGSEFTVRLPILADIAAPMHAGGVEPATAGNGARRILVVEDNQDAALSLAMLLELDGSEVQVAHDGLDAVEKACDYRPDVILLDIGLPRLNGYEVCRAIRGKLWAGDIRIIALTGWGQEDDWRKAVEAGFDGHLVKPVEHVELMTLMGELLARA